MDGCTNESMGTSAVVLQISELPTGLDQLIEASVREGFRFVERLGNEWDSGANRFAGVGEAFFAAYVGHTLAGVCGLNRDPYSASPGVGRLRRLYVPPPFRRRGVARSLVVEALSLAREHYVLVRIRTDNPEAVAFYETLGFVAANSSPEATQELAMAGWSAAQQGDEADRP